ncbi:MAG: aminotransferase class I/II-fold pyridoxal phosphate-dependent enzyme [Clostridia bacterium]|nr:aminotransferase class I/II-fold pyridoxal phosphate-dependent enzyme [Clostridia bacterium]
MVFFTNDYCIGAAPEILERLQSDNLIRQPGYGTDPVCQSAKEKIRKACRAPEADVFFVTGGTQTNQLVIDTVLEPYEGVIAARTGHVAVHEAGAIEYSGHKVIELPGHEGKVDAGELESYLTGFEQEEAREHMVAPGMVYISHPTEYGTLYTKDELKTLRKVCDGHGIRLYLDGARLAYALCAQGTDVTLPDISKLADVFYIGGTKCGALFGEAIVFPKGDAPSHYVTRIKQHGALLAKGWLLGIQFETLFTDGLYYKLGEHADRMADRIRKELERLGYPFLIETTTNQIFIILKNEQLDAFRAIVCAEVWEVPDSAHTAIRICTSWATTEQEIKSLLLCVKPFPKINGNDNQ